MGQCACACFFHRPTRDRCAPQLANSGRRRLTGDVPLCVRRRPAPAGVRTCCSIVASEKKTSPRRVGPPASAAAPPGKQERKEQAGSKSRTCGTSAHRHSWKRRDVFRRASHLCSTRPRFCQNTLSGAPAQEARFTNVLAAPRGARAHAARPLGRPSPAAVQAVASDGDEESNRARPARRPSGRAARGSAGHLGTCLDGASAWSDPCPRMAGAWSRQSRRELRFSDAPCTKTQSFPGLAL